MNYSYQQLESVIRKKISSGGSIIIEPKGTSMLPLIRQGIDKVELFPVDGRLKKYDIPFYKRSDGDFVLHRIIKVCDDSYILRGDNQTVNECNVTDDMIIAVARNIIKDGEIIPVTDKKYLKYSKKQVSKKTRLQKYLWIYNKFFKSAKKRIRHRNDTI